jgi:hypothetical protein
MCFMIEVHRMGLSSGIFGRDVGSRHSVTVETDCFSRSRMTSRIFKTDL